MTVGDVMRNMVIVCLWLSCFWQMYTISLYTFICTQKWQGKHARTVLFSVGQRKANACNAYADLDADLREIIHTIQPTLYMYVFSQAFEFA